MEERQIILKLQKCQSTLENIRQNGHPPDKKWTDVFVYFDETVKSLWNEKNDMSVNSEMVILEAFQIVMNEIEQSLQFINKAFENMEQSTLLIITSSLNILWTSFTYCKMSGDKNENEINENLASFFKLSYQSLKMIIDILDNRSETLFHGDKNSLLNVVVPMINCSKVLADIDIMASVAVWKFIKKLFNLHKDLIINSCSEFKSVFEVCSLACHSFNVCFDLLEKKDMNMINKYQKVIRFFLGIVLLFLKEFKSNMDVDMCSKVYELIHLIQKQSLNETRKRYEEKNCTEEYENMFSTLLCVNDPLIKDFFEVRNSANCVVGKIHLIKSVTKEDNVVYLMDILNFVECLIEKPEHIDAWMKACTTSQKDIFEETSYHSILELTFSYIQLSNFDMFSHCKEKTVLDKSHCFKEASLYEIVLGKVCAFVTTLPQKYFVQLETLMLSNLLKPQSKYCSLLATDLWCFVARWGKPDLCVNYIIFLGILVKKLFKTAVTESSIKNVPRLLQRLFWFLEDHQHDQIVQNFPINADNIVIWRYLPITHFKMNNMSKLCSELLETALSFIEMKDGKQNDEHNVVCAVECLANMIKNNEIYEKLPINTKNRVYNHVIEFWSCFRNIDEDITISEPLVLSMLSLTSEFLPFLDGSHLFDILSVINDILYNTESLAFHTKCSFFLVHLKNISFPPGVERNCLSVTSKIFQYLLNHKNMFIDCQTMKALKMFAEETVYSRSLVTFLPQSRKKDFTNFLRKEALNRAVEFDKVFEVLKQFKNNGGHNEDEKMEDEDEDEEEHSEIRNILNKISKYVKDFNVDDPDSLPSDIKDDVRLIISNLEFAFGMKNN